MLYTAVSDLHVPEQVRDHAAAQLMAPWAALPEVEKVFSRHDVPPVADTQRIVQGWADMLQASDQPEQANITLHRDGARWAAMSLLQKGLRRSKPEWAHMAISGLFNYGNQATVWQRLATIGMEDLGLAALPATMLAIGMYTKQIACEPSLEYELAMGVANLMAHSVKDRSVCDLVCGFYYKTPRWLAITDDLEAFGSGELADIVIDERRAFAQRCVALKHLYLRKNARDLSWAAFRQMKLPAAVLYCTVGYQSKSKIPMWACLPISWQIATRGTIGVDNLATQDPGIVAGIPGCAFDMFVSDGKRSMAYHRKSNGGIKDFFDRSTSTGMEKMEQHHYAVFEAEGGVLDRSLDFPLRNHIAEETLVDGFASVGMEPAAAVELIELVSAGLADLDRVRDKLIQAPVFIPVE